MAAPRWSPCRGRAGWRSPTPSTTTAAPSAARRSSRSSWPSRPSPSTSPRPAPSAW